MFEAPRHALRHFFFCCFEDVPLALSSPSLSDLTVGYKDEVQTWDLLLVIGHWSLVFGATQLPGWFKWGRWHAS